MNRREALKLAALTATQTALPLVFAAQTSAPILDAHIHLFNPTRPGGIPWPFPTDKILYKPALPNRYAKIAQPFGIVGAIAIEASPLAADNDWLLDVAAKNSLIVGIIGNLNPAAPSYTSDLERLHRNPLFLGFRYGNLWNRDLFEDLQKPNFLEGLKALAQAGLVFESANPDPKLIQALLKIANAIPDLRIVLDHLPNAKVPSEKAAQTEFAANLQELAKHKQVFVKLSEIPRLENGKLLTNLSAYQDSLDQIWNTFGEDHILFGSDWPNSDTTAPFEQTMAIVRKYFATKSPAARAKYFYKNSHAAYHWQARTPVQASV